MVFNESVYAETVADLEAAHFPVSIEQRDPEYFAALQYLMPTALVVYLLKPYAEKFLGKLAEDNYDSCKAAQKSFGQTALQKIVSFVCG